VESMARVMRRWLPVAAAVTCVCGLVYAAVQQDLRRGADDPQIQMAEDAARAIEQGTPAEARVSDETIAIERSLAPFVAVFDDRGEILKSSGMLHGRAPRLPAGVLEYVRRHGEDRITWQPERGVRVAAVVARCAGERPCFVLAGRSLREIEKREAAILLMAFLAWVVAMAASLVAAAVVEALLPRYADVRSKEV